MGYESRVYLVMPGGFATDVHETDEDGNWTPEVTGRKALYCQQVAMVDLSKAGYQTRTGLLFQAAREAERARLAQGTEEAPVHGYGLYVSGDIFDDRDKYGDPNSPVDLDALVEAVDADHADEPYRRFALLGQTARAWRDLLAEFPGAVVLHYGY